MGIDLICTDANRRQEAGGREAGTGVRPRTGVAEQRRRVQVCGVSAQRDCVWPPSPREGLWILGTPLCPHRLRPGREGLGASVLSALARVGQMVRLGSAAVLALRRIARSL